MRKVTVQKFILLAYKLEILLTKLHDWTTNFGKKDTLNQHLGLATYFKAGKLIKFCHS